VRGSAAIIEDRVDRALDISQYIIIPYSDYLVSILGKPRVADDILLILVMLTPIKLDDNTFFKTDKIRNIVADRILASEFETVDCPPADMLPQQTLGIR